MAATRRRTALAAGVAVAAGLAGGAFAWWRFRDPPGEGEVPSEFWARSFLTPDGESLAMGGLRGRYLLVNFWATWCPPCVEEMPLLDRFYRANAAQGWEVLGLAVDQAPAVRQFLQRTPVSFRIGMAGLDGTELSRSFGNQVGGLPFTVLIGADGRVLQRRIGQVSADELARWKAAAGA
ncbi:TlpA disulfide reductase family protein [Ramlibacter sp. AN1015]|uniref:TlpA family protein disulfide reductase n=1 Tax=Ramlibacter sp. AN1015 TaxID=3133428 RepID=UPI0030BD501D